ncbi:VWA domain-containing protein [Luedemannella helvata]|uniref:VWFA domain-containing protein n=1 Tax=Luedemannella helvata TaxID=349315 RepID=A0ABP4XHI5_9ACTN
MSVQYPVMVAVAVAACAAMVVGYRWLNRQRGAALAQLGAAPSGRRAWRRHVPPLLFVAALTLLLLGVARPEATVAVPRPSGTVILAFDVSNSMTADDVAPTRLAAAQSAAAGFVRGQPASVDIGVVAFDRGALTTLQPTNRHDEALAAINRLRPAGGTSLGQAILAGLTAIVGRPVGLPDPSGATPSPDLGYHGAATIVVLSDGEDTGGPDALAAATLAADAGVHIHTIGVGTVAGTTIEVDGFQVATALDEGLLTEIAQTTTGTYHRAADGASLDEIYQSITLRITAKPERMELTGAAVGGAVLLLTIGGLLMIGSSGRIV